MLEYIFKSLDKWPGEETPEHKREASLFTSKWTQTMQLLERETRQLHAISDSLSIATFHPPGAITRAGTIRIGSRLPPRPGVIISFDVRRNNKRETIQYECDHFRFWEDNVRAIALALESLRRVDRFHVTSRGRQGVQYDGATRALPPAPINLGQMDDLAAAELIFRNTVGFQSGRPLRDILDDPKLMQAAYREAAARVHPDRGGSNDLAASVNAAYQVLLTRFG